MKTRTVLFLAILASVLFFPLRPFGSVGFLPNARAALTVPNPSITLQANFAGWNSLNLRESILQLAPLSSFRVRTSLPRRTLLTGPLTLWLSTSQEQRLVRFR